MFVTNYGRAYIKESFEVYSIPRKHYRRTSSSLASRIARKLPDRLKLNSSNKQCKVKLIRGTIE